MVGRRRTRAKQKAFHLSDSSELDASTDEDADVGVPQASTRKARGKQKAVAKSSGVRITKKGKLGMIAEMPLDVLYEVSSSSPFMNAACFMFFTQRYSPSLLLETSSGCHGPTRGSDACSPVAPRGTYGRPPLSRSMSFLHVPLS